MSTQCSAGERWRPLEKGGRVLDSRFALPAGTVLDGSYRIVRVVGTGGFGITYEAEDIALSTKVALKEYYPDEFGDRDARLSVRPKSERHKQTFEWGRQSFLKEARTLARFEHPSIVRVARVFEAHSTAYMVMGFERGQSFESWLKGLGRPPTQAELDAIVAPLLAALQVMHAANFLHRDIAPDNIIVRADGSPVLLDFGAARRSVAEMSRAMTGIVKAGYSPHEQYASDARLQGPWSDLYALGGTLYRAVTGFPPEEATLRVDEDRMAPATLAAKGSYRPGFLEGIDACLKVRHSDRPRSVAQLRPMLLGSGTAKPGRAERSVKAPTRAPSVPAPSVRVPQPAPAGPARRWGVVAAAALVIAGGAFGGYGFTRWQEAQRERTSLAERAKQAAERRAEFDAEQRRAAEQQAARRQADAEKGRQDDARIAAEAEARRKADAEAEARRRADAEAEERRKEDERRRIASRQDPPPGTTTPAPGSSEPAPPRGQVVKLPIKLGSSPGDASKGWLGMSMEGLELPLARALGRTSADGVLVLSTMPGSPAAAGGLRFGDVIVGLNGRPVSTVNEFIQRSSSMAPGSQAMVEVWRVGSDAGDFLETLLKRADAGDAAIMFRLGRMYSSALGVARDDAEAARWFRKAADAGNANAKAALASALLDGRGVAADRTEAVRLLRAAAADNHPESMNRLAHLLVEGKGVEKDAAEASALLTRAAEAGHVPSMVDLAAMYANGIGIKADPAKAATWFNKAADLGNAAGMAGLANLYLEGKGVATDVARAVGLYKRAADLGNAGALSQLALLHIQGKGVEKSETAAVAYYRKAAALGNPVAMNNLAWMLQGGLGVPRKDPQEAASLIMQALDRRYEFSVQQMTQKSSAWSKEFRQALQTRLRDAGFFTGRVDGEFGASTITAINAYMNRPR
jgi:TPR repeat protein/tRNA A-37 threonylcarbamoyl transferase component Bud32